MAEIRKKPTDLYPKLLFPSHYTGPSEGFLIMEGDEHQLANYTLFYFPEIRLTYVPLFDAAEVTENTRNQSELRQSQGYFPPFSQSSRTNLDFARAAVFRHGEFDFQRRLKNQLIHR